MSEAKTLIGQGYKILRRHVLVRDRAPAGPDRGAESVLYISGAAANDGITGLNRYTFRAGRQSYQDVPAASRSSATAGKNVLVFAQDYAFGQGNVAAVQAVLGTQGHHVSSILVPLSATDFTPFAQQAAACEARSALRRLGRHDRVGDVPGAGAAGCVQAPRPSRPGLPSVTTWTGFGPAATQIKFLSHYVWNAPHNKVNNWLIAKMRKRNQLPDLFTPDGFVTSQMIVHALQKAKGDRTSTR